MTLPITGDIETDLPNARIMIKQYTRNGWPVAQIRQIETQEWQRTPEMIKHINKLIDIICPESVPVPGQGELF